MSETPEPPNPFVALLPERDVPAWRSLLTVAPSIFPVDVDASDAARRAHLSTVASHFVALGHTLDLALSFAFSLRCGLQARHPFGADLHLRARIELAQLARMSPGIGNREAPLGFGCMCVFGPIGTGKSRTLRRVQATYEQVIPVELPQHGGTTIQHLRFMSLLAPSEASVRGLYESFIHDVDDRLGTNYANSRLYARHTAHTLRQLVASIVRAHAIGLLVLDEAGNLDARKSRGYQAMINDLVGLTDMIGLPLILAGTPLAMDRLALEPRLASRILAHVVPLDPLRRNVQWHTLIRSLLKYQVTTNRVPFSEGLSGALWKTTGGVIRHVNTMFVLAQEYLIANRTLCLTPELIEALFDARPEAYRRLVTLTLRQHKGEIMPDVGELRFVAHGLSSNSN